MHPNVVHLLTSNAKGIDANNFPWKRCVHDNWLNCLVETFNFVLGLTVVQIGWNYSSFQDNDSLGYRANTRGTFGVTEITLHSAN